MGQFYTNILFTVFVDEILFDVPDKIPSETVKITAEFEKNKLDKIDKDRDLSKFIL